MRKTLFFNRSGEPHDRGAQKIPSEKYLKTRFGIGERQYSHTTLRATLPTTSDYKE